MAPQGPELRIGLVLYGGVSLAVYIYGVVVEVQRLLRAAVELEAGGEPDQMSAYARALHKAEIGSVTVDIVSGTSAGGINGVLLSKALARGSDVGTVRDVWLDGGDIEQLLQPPSVHEPESLLRSGQFEALLRKGLGTLGKAGSGPRAPILDLFVSSTHLRGGQRVFTDSLQRKIATRQHRYVFRLKLRSEQRLLDQVQGYDEDEFGDDERLVKLARATSAFPAAFEPVKIKSTDDLLERGEADGWFADGGILNNKPFTEAVETILTRSSDRPVNRWLFSVDPDPVPPAEEDGSAGEKPAFDEIAIRAVATIPRYQSIVRDLVALSTHNETVEAAEQAIIEGEAEIAAAADGEDAGAGEGDGGQPAQPPPGYRAMARQAWGLEVADRLMAAVRTGPEAGGDRLGLHAAFREAAEALGGELPDLGFRLRRVYYLIKLLRLAGLAIPASGEVETPADVRRALWTEFEFLSSRLWDLLSSEPLAAGEGEPDQVAQAAANARLRDVGSELASAARESDDRLRERLGETILLLPLPASEDRFGVQVAEVIDDFERRDAILLAAELYGGLKERDRVEHAQVSPASATNTGIDRELKLAGVTLGHFGGFLDAGWRANDLMWGRLDGSEMLIRAIIGESGEGEIGGLADDVQEEVLAEELPDALGGPAPWREKLAEHVGDGPSVGDLSGRRLTRIGLRAATVLRGMLAAAESSAPAGTSRIRSFLLRAVANSLGFVLALVYLPAMVVVGKGMAVLRIATAIALLVSAAGVVALALGAVGVLELDDVGLPAVIALAVYPAFLAGCWVVNTIKAKLASY
jgi:predicted acylesterase/phospholipase RssA